MELQLNCPYCSNKASLRDSACIYGESYGMIFICFPCDAYVGCHPSGLPKGSLANRNLRNLRKQCHLKFDGLWRSGDMSRSEAYKWLQKSIKLSAKEAHIGEFNELQCKKLLDLRN